MSRGNVNDLLAWVTVVRERSVTGAVASNRPCAGSGRNSRSDDHTATSEPFPIRLRSG